MDGSTTDGTQAYRYERKFVIPPYMLQDMPLLLIHSSFNFREIFSERIVNNIYFDTPLLKFYHENVQGVPDRKKIRLRWYNSYNQNTGYRLEIKRKNGLVGAKDVFNIFMTPDEVAEHGIVNCENLHTDIRLELSQTRPSLLNYYKRKYFLSDDGKFRITIDYDIHYLNPTGFNTGDRINSIGEKDNESILELKYAHDNDEAAEAVTNQLQLRLSKKSKYVSGVENIYLF